MSTAMEIQVEAVRREDFHKCDAAEFASLIEKSLLLNDGREEQVSEFVFLPWQVLSDDSDGEGGCLPVAVINGEYFCILRDMLPDPADFHIGFRLGTALKDLQETLGIESDLYIRLLHREEMHQALKSLLVYN